MTDTIAVFTARSPERILAEGGSQAWKLNPTRARQLSWLVCTQNQHNPDHEFSDASEPHGAAYLVGKISRIAPTPEPHSPGRWIIEISEYATIRQPNVWQGWRNPIRYTSLAELGIDINKLDFKPMPKREARASLPVRISSASEQPRKGLTIPEAKLALALTYGVKPDAIEIVIRG